jgi:hypothetical protein
VLRDGASFIGSAARSRRTAYREGFSWLYPGVVHDFMLLNTMRDTHATRAAIAQATAYLRAALGTDAAQ